MEEKVLLEALKKLLAIVKAQSVHRTPATPLHFGNVEKHLDKAQCG